MLWWRMRCTLTRLSDQWIYIGRTCLVAPMQLNTNIIRGCVNRAQLLWNVRNFCETCTTTGKRAQHLWHVHNISDTCTTSPDTCTTSLKRSHIEYLKTLGGGGETLVDLTAIGAGWQPESSPDRLRYNEATMMADSHVCYNHLLWAYL